MNASRLDGLVGRATERAHLRSRLAQAADGRGSVVLIGGETGIGKSALLAAFRSEAVEAGRLVLHARAVELVERPAFGVWRDAFETCPARPDVFAPGECSPAVTLDTAARFVADAARSQPLVVLLDDLHWADGPSLDLLRYVGRMLAGLPALVVATHQSANPEQLDLAFKSFLLALVRDVAPCRLELRRLSTHEVRDLVIRRYGRLSDAERLIAYLERRAAGNPFLVLELLHALETTDVLETDGAQWRVGDLDSCGVPPLVQHLLAERLNDFDADERHLLSGASVIGVDVPLDLLAVVAGISEERVLALLDRAEQRRVLIGSTDGTRARFALSLLRDVCYSVMPAAHRRDWHRRVAEELARHATRDPETVANHFRSAHDARALEWLTRSAQQAERAFAYRTAAARYTIALQLAEQANPPVLALRGWLAYKRTRCEANGVLDGSQSPPDDPLLAALAQCDSGRMSFAAGAYQEGLHLLTSGTNAFPALAGDDSMELGARLADAHDARATLVTALAATGRLAEARVAAEMATEEVGSQRGLGIAAAQLGLLDEARRHFATARACQPSAAQVAMTAAAELLYVHVPYSADHTAERRRLIHDLHAWPPDASAGGSPTWTDIVHAYVSVLGGDWDHALDIATSALQGTHIAPLRDLAHVILATLARAHGDTPRAWGHVLTVLPAGVATEPGSALFSMAVQVQLLAVDLAIDKADFGGALEWLKSLERWFGWNGARLGRAEHALRWTRYHHMLGETRRARRDASTALAEAAAPSQPLAALAAHRVLGELDAELGQLDTAAAHLTISMKLADACAAPYERALTLLSVAELRRSVGPAADARAALDEAQAVCAALGATPALARAHQLTARLRPGAPDARPFPAGLSAREIEVLRLVAEGRTNRQIARHLVLSERTVPVHVRNILTKTNSANRAAATAFALRHGLA
jgi:DNA-binding CsgD family transcriptional regulator